MSVRGPGEVDRDLPRAAAGSAPNATPADPRRVIVAPDKFKGSLSAAQVAHIVAGVLRRRAPAREVIECPIADGGEGTVALALGAGFTSIVCRVPGPLGAPVDAEYAMSQGTAVIEMAAAAGLALLPGAPDPQAAGRASTRGVGLLIADALDQGASRIVLGLGGSATTDGGAGMVTALGARLSDAAGAPLPPGGAALADLAALDVSDLDPRLASVDVVVACDVANPLLGPQGAAAVYGPQKGADPMMVQTLDECLGRWADRVAAGTGRDHRFEPGTGAAGGTAFAAVALLGGRIVSGIEVGMELSGLQRLLPGADLLVIGEGSLDAQSLHGKGPVELAARATAVVGSVVAVAGRCTLTAGQLAAAGIDRAYPLTDLESDLDVCLRDARRLLEATADRVADDWLKPEPSSGG